MKYTTILLPLLATLVTLPALAGIPAHPDDITFKELSYEPPVAAEYRHVLDNGTVVYVAEDHRVPLIDITIHVRADDWQVPAGMEGLHEACFELMTSGAGEWDATWIEEEIAFLGASLRSRSSGYGGRFDLQTLSKDFEHGLDILFAVMQEPTFDQDRLEQWQEERVASFKERNDHPARIERMEWNRLMFASSWWKPATEADVRSISREALMDWGRRWVQPAHMVISVSGDVDTRAILKDLETHMEGWQGEPQRFGPRDRVYSGVKPGVYLVNKEVNQTRARCALPGLRRDDPAWHAASMMNEILGAGGMSSKLLNRIRTEEGLAYSVGSRLEELEFGQGLLLGIFQTKTESTPYAMSLLVDEYNKVAAGEIEEEAFENARNQLLQAFPTWFGDAGSIVNTLADEELSGRYASNPSYYKNLRDEVRALELENLKQAARDLLKPDQLVWLLVGDAEGLLLPDEEHDVRVEDFGPVTRLPLRDPLTQEPLSER